MFSSTYPLFVSPPVLLYGARRLVLSQLLKLPLPLSQFLLFSLSPSQRGRAVRPRPAYRFGRSAYRCGLSLCLSLVSVTVSITVSITLSVTVSVIVSITLSVTMSVIVSVAVSITVSITLSVTVSVIVFVAVSIILSVTLSVTPSAVDRLTAGVSLQVPVLSGCHGLYLLLQYSYFLLECLVFIPEKRRKNPLKVIKNHNFKMHTV